MDEVRLRDVRQEDLPTFFVHQNDPQAMQMAAFTREEMQVYATFEARWAMYLSNPDIVVRAVEVGGQPVGHVVCFLFEGQREVGYWIARESWGRGIATRALELFLEELPMRPLHARVAQDNPASLRVLEKCGFRVIGEEPAFALARGKDVVQIVHLLESQGTGALMGGA